MTDPNATTDPTSNPTTPPTTPGTSGQGLPTLTPGQSLPTLTPGQSLPSLTLPPISRTTLALFAGASGDHNPIHIDFDTAHSAGLDDVFAHGMLSMGYLGRYLTETVGQERLRTWDVRFTAITPVHATPTCTGTVRAVDEAAGTADLDLAVTLEDGTVTVTGRATISLAEAAAGPSGTGSPSATGTPGVAGSPSSAGTPGVAGSPSATGSPSAPRGRHAADPSAATGRHAADPASADPGLVVTLDDGTVTTARHVTFSLPEVGAEPVITGGFGATGPGATCPDATTPADSTSAAPDPRTTDKDGQ